jgi:2-keto-4-pentenoate hydratase/2-oxohepta-3-ene-1,7-dioic acid hydratase in catechol pathway
MRLARFSTAARPSVVGLIEGDRVRPLNAPTGETQCSMIPMIERGLGYIRECAASSSSPAVPIAGTRLEAPLPDARKFLGIGFNYGTHVAEGNRAVPQGQTWFNKQTSCITGPFDPVILPRLGVEFDYEVELAVVIGRRCRDVPAADALAVVAGFMVTNDFSVREWQRASPTHTLGKSFDTHGPIGPWLTLSDEIVDPQALNLRLTVNGEERQSDNTRSMIHSIADQIAYLTSRITLLPGDILSTGTPAGVAAWMKPPVWLKAGDVVRAEIEGLGYIENEIIAQSDGEWEASTERAIDVAATAQ